MGPWAVLYFVCIVLFGRFYLINLVLAVVAASYENEVQTSRLVSKKSYNTTFNKQRIIPIEKNLFITFNYLLRQLLTISKSLH